MWYLRTFTHYVNCEKCPSVVCMCACGLLGLGPSEGLMTDALLTTARVPQATGS